MIRQIDEMAAGNMNIERPSALSYDDNIQLEVFAGEEYTGSFVIRCAPGVSLDGDAVTDCCNITALKTVSTDNGLMVEYVFDPKSQKSGSSVFGVFEMITNAGEFHVRFRASIISKKLISAVGEIKDLDEFIKFYFINPKEAAKLYASDAFEELLGNTRARLYYKSLKDVEEFLIAIGAKKRTKFVLDRNELVFSELLLNENTGTFSISKKNSGSLFLRLKTDSPFIELKKDVITDDDFIGAKCTVSVSLRREMLHLGENLGLITVYSNFQEEDLSVRAIVASEIDITKEKYITEKKKFLKLCRIYESYLAEETVTGNFVKEAIAIVDSMSTDDVIYRLIKAYALLINGQTQEYRWLMKDLKEEIDPDYPGAMMLYNCLLYMGDTDHDYRAKQFSKIVDIYQANSDSSFVRYCMLLIDSEAMDSKNKLMMIVRWIREGENSPFFFGYACKLLNQYPFFLTDLKREMLLILNWGSKKNYIGRALTEQILSLYSTAGRYDVLLDRLLTRCQVKYPTRDTLTAVCAYRIKGELVREIDHIWYRKAIDEDIKLTGLYEYYIASMEKGTIERLPNQVCIYFQYNNYLSRKQKAILYVNVVSFKEQDPATYDVYKKLIKDYVVSELSAGHIDENLAILYNEFLDEVAMDREMYDSLASIVYVNRFTCHNTAAKYVYIIHEDLSAVRSYPVKKGIAYVPVYPGEYVYVLADENGGFFVDNESCEQEKLFYPAKIMRSALDAGSMKIPYILHHLQTKQSMLGLNDTEVSYLRVLVESDKISDSYKKRISPVLVKYHQGSFESDEIMKNLDVRYLDESAKKIYSEGLVRECIYAKAYEFVDYYGPDSVSGDMLEQIIMYCLTYIKDYDESLCKLMKYAVKNGTKRQIIYKYLNLYMQGTAEELYNVWKTGKRLSVDVRAMTEKLMLLMLFTGEIKSFAYELYSESLGNLDSVNLRLAYANYFAYIYITKCAAPCRSAFDYLINEYRKLRDIPDYIKVGILKYLSSKEELSQGEEELACDIITEFIDRGMYFGFFKSFGSVIQVRFHLYDKYIITIKSSAEDIALYYRLDDDDEARGELIDVFMDYHTFVLSAGESDALHYRVDEIAKRYTALGAGRVVPAVNENIVNKYSYIKTGHSPMAVRAMEITAEKLFLPV